MFKFHEKYFDVPMEERLYVLPDARQKLFINMIENFKVFCPDIQLIYGAMNFNEDLKVDYLVIFKVMVENREIILWDNPVLYTNRTIPSYRYAIRNNEHQAFFMECRAHFSQISIGKFYEYLQTDHCHNLSLDPKSPNYWKNPNNSEKLISGMSELAIQYTPKGFRNPIKPTDDMLSPLGVMMKYGKKE